MVNKHEFGAKVIKINLSKYTLCEVTLHPSCTVLYVIDIA